MTLERIERGCSVFIDANILIYHFTGVSEECSNFLSGCEKGEIIGVTSLNVYVEVLHRLMMIEAVRKDLVQPPNIAKKLKQHPEYIKKLKDYAINAQKIPAMGVAVRPVSYETILKSHAIRAAYGLMVNDSLIVASMHEEGLQLIATNDELFTKVEGIYVYKPQDVHMS